MQDAQFMRKDQPLGYILLNYCAIRKEGSFSFFVLRYEYLDLPYLTLRYLSIITIGTLPAYLLTCLPFAVFLGTVLYLSLFSHYWVFFPSIPVTPTMLLSCLNPGSWPSIN